MLVNATEMLLKARDGHYGVPQFNINNLEWTKAVLTACEEMKSPVILGVSEGAGKYMTGFKTVAAMVDAMVDSMGITVPVSLIGVLSIFLLFLKINNIILFLLKILISVIMVIVAFGYKSIKYTISNIIYFYMTSIVLAGFLYLIKGNSSNFNLNYIVLLIIGPIILFIYYKSNKKLKNTYSDYYKIKIVFDNIEYNLVSFYDNGNNLKDPISRKSIIIVGNNRLEKIYNIRSPVYVPVITVKGTHLMKCFKPSYIILNDKKIYNYLIGESSIKFSDGVECLLNKSLKEDGYV